VTRPLAADGESWEHEALTSDEIAKLKSMAQKVPAAKIAEKIGRGFPATRVKAHELGLALRFKKEASLSGLEARRSLVE
jgi:hypothetical protein